MTKRGIQKHQISRDKAVEIRYERYEATLFSILPLYRGCGANLTFSAYANKACDGVAHGPRIMHHAALLLEMVW